MVACGAWFDDIFNLQLTKAELRANGASEALIDKIGANAFRYFRAMAEPFKHLTCEAFRDLNRGSVDIASSRCRTLQTRQT